MDQQEFWVTYLAKRETCQTIKYYYTKILPTFILVLERDASRPNGGVSPEMWSTYSNYCATGLANKQLHWDRKIYIMKTEMLSPEITCNEIISRIPEGCVFGLVQ